MAMYQCKACEGYVTAGKKHECKPKPKPFNVIMTDEDKQKLK